MREKILFAIVILTLFSIESSAQNLGCCSNPGAGALTCTNERLSRENECCPTPETNFSSYYKSQQNQFGPLNFGECRSAFFRQNTQCSSVAQCALGCCCSDLGGSLLSQSQCQGPGLTFRQGETNCESVCPRPQCNDNLDNDGNGCIDYGRDSGCLSSADNTETNGNCIASSANCDDPVYSPKLVLDIRSVKGQKKLAISWSDECSDSASYYEVFRCPGNCTSPILLSNTYSTQYVDHSNELQYNSLYTYKIVAHYDTRTITPSANGSARLGDESCMGRLTNNLFCNNNAVYRCDNSNQLIFQGPRCASNKICFAYEDKSYCLDNITCNYEAANPFGLFYTQSECEGQQNNPRFCYYDRSYSIVNSCYACRRSMKCSDYKSKQSCSNDNCKLSNCEWRALNDEIGTGVCVSNQNSNCDDCEPQNLPFGAKSSKIYEGCTREKAALLSNSNNRCYFSSQRAQDCSLITCSSYSSSDCSSSQITLDELNRITNPSNDQCSIGTCQLFGSECGKNADGDNIRDCNETICEMDTFAPNTTLTQVMLGNLADSINIQIFDKISGNGSSILRAFNNYKTYFCMEPCSQGNPYPNSTSSNKLVIIGLSAYDASTGAKILQLNEGLNSIKYYSQDPSRNLETIKTIQIEARTNNTRPRLLSINVTNGKQINSRIYTKNTRPSIKINFFEPAKITLARLVNSRSGFVQTIFQDTQITNNFSYQLNSALVDGQYALEVDAVSSNGISMGRTIFIIIIDTMAPDVSITPSSGTFENSTIPFRLAFNEEVELTSVSINSQDKKQSFVSDDNRIYKALLNISDGNKVLAVQALDFAGNQVSKNAQFIVDAMPPSVWMYDPEFGVSPSYTFNLEVETDNNANCKWSFDNNLSYDFSDAFSSTGATIHRINNFNLIQNDDKIPHKLHVKCRDQKSRNAAASFEISVDTTAPEITNIIAFPNPIVERPALTVLRAETSEPTRCKFSKTSSDFDSMEGKFFGFDEKQFRTINTRNISFAEEGTHSLYIACKNKAGLSSINEKIDINIDFDSTIKVISRTSPVFNSTKVTLSVETNKLSQCLFSDSRANPLNWQIIGTEPGYFHKQDLTLSNGRHTYSIKCRDRDLNTFSDTLQIYFVIDTSAPIMISVDDKSPFANENQNCFRDRLRIKSEGQDPESGIKEYYYSVIKKSTSQVIASSSYQSVDDYVFVRNLSLEENQEYFFRVRARNNVNLDSSTIESDGILINLSTCPGQEGCAARGDCSAGEVCTLNSQCESLFCKSGRCAQSTCTDSAKNQQESDIDCAGPCAKCETGKKCNQNSDCTSGNCAYGTCANSDLCFDGILNSGEADIDCAGPCSACGDGKSCSRDSDCAIAMSCVNSICNVPQDPITEQPKDTDADGDQMPDDWEIANGLDPNDALDADLDNDDDGLSNYNEFLSNTDPNVEDTDADGYNDAEEVDEGTDPTDSNDFPKSSIMSTILLILGILILLGGFGYLGYRVIEKKKVPERQIRINRQMQQTQPIIQRTIAQKSIQVSIPREMLRHKEEMKNMERKKLFESFSDRESKEQKLSEKLDQKIDPQQIIKREPAENQKENTGATQRKERPKKSKEDVFIKLKEMTKDTKKRKNAKRKK